ncbi:hypothetical protein Q4511_13050 [Paracoccus sp. 1_MG-2023]|uniref:hypothetical protein n=1 Tax=unclassified Paracoccus (in: a-proteobacteria) TaxID=2688777 RepID=UPI001C09F4FB|nr:MULTISPECIES: hypothetical protein [unclassified Paracoccus (in: a-proteobacteria)]MBU2956414.1 hypothetical protein [Paracoccus sp. C2R09]MDO6669852.1 hypothetical protein [Paracoccus sp. 1_MG-2023]
MKPLAAAIALLPSATLAHPGHHDHADPTHLLTQGDHVATIAMIAAVGIAAWALLRGRS